MSASHPVLLIEDDPSIQRFVAMALEELPVTLTLAATLAEARLQLRSASFRLVVSDLMLPDGSALALLQERADAGRDVSTARWIVMSAGVTPIVDAELRSLGVATILHKPVALAELFEAVQTLADDNPASLRGEPHCVVIASSHDSGPDVDGSAADRANAVQQFFGGDEGLYRAFCETSEPQFLVDAALGDAAQARGDLAELRRVAHSLKSALLLTGRPRLSQTAHAVELLAARGDTQALAAWLPIAAALRNPD